MLSTACGESDGDDGVTAAETTSDSTASTTMTTSSTDASTTESTTATSTATTTASTTAAETEGTTATTATTGDTSAATSASDDTGATACGDGVCGADEVCVQPCCGGPAPGCFDTTVDGTCKDGGEPVPAAECPVPCSTETCCPPQPCEAAPDYCAGIDEIQCHETQCSVGDCFGTLQDGALFCECA